MGEPGNVRRYRLSLDQRAANWCYWRRRDAQDAVAAQSHAGRQIDLLETPLAAEDAALLETLRGRTAAGRRPCPA